jgi:hypothetical protein
MPGHVVLNGDHHQVAATPLLPEIAAGNTVEQTMRHELSRLCLQLIFRSDFAKQAR